MSEGGQGVETSSDGLVVFVVTAIDTVSIQTY